jgi:hypothetical protein
MAVTATMRASRAAAAMLRKVARNDRKGRNDALAGVPGHCRDGFDGEEAARIRRLTDPASGAYATRPGSTDPGAGGSGEVQLVTRPRPAPKVASL